MKALSLDVVSKLLQRYRRTARRDRAAFVEELLEYDWPHDERQALQYLDLIVLPRCPGQHASMGGITFDDELAAGSIIQLLLSGWSANERARIALVGQQLVDEAMWNQESK